MSKNNSAARDTAPMDNPANQSFLMDIEESVRRDELNRLWKEYGPWLIGGIVIAVLFTGVLSAYRAWDRGVGSEQTATLMTALDSDDVPGALGDLSGDLRPGARAVALLTQAAALLQDDKRAEAAAVFEKAADDRAIPETYRHLALLESVRLRGGEETADRAELLKRLDPLLKDKNGPWHAQARIQAAVLSAHGAEPDYKTARDHLAVVIAGEDVPPALVEKARALDHVYSLRTGKE